MICQTNSLRHAYHTFTHSHFLNLRRMYKYFCTTIIADYMAILLVCGIFICIISTILGILLYLQWRLTIIKWMTWILSLSHSSSLPSFSFSFTRRFAHRFFLSPVCKYAMHAVQWNFFSLLYIRRMSYYCRLLAPFYSLFYIITLDSSRRHRTSHR